MVKTTGVIFDVFSTLIKINDRRNPYLQLLRYGRKQGLCLSGEHLRMLMTQELGWQEAADLLRIRAGDVVLRGFAGELQKELASMTLFDDAQEAISMLREAGVKIGLCSNSASGYGPTVRELLPNLDAYGFSYELGVLKPDPLIYRTVCQELEVVPGRQLGGERVVMVGDSVKCDRDGARAAGLAGFYLNRTGRGDFSSLTHFAECVLIGYRHGFMRGAIKVPADFEEMGRDHIRRNFEGEP
ncbi:HAD superfamily hydrolase (TIGR01549 family) [Pseudomonas flavescens]|uniref:HAD superfamily hydrolase (TIGR01549 family) n=1 Tax=Phytopseudomonas flavescens TaxID=29435 RepID=A0A7Y9XJ06_9GAMM|nr:MULTISPECIES: HAD-IA family hydrolase [Pseudomonas]NYH72300.1 HAD superfamily hydrolase (TIGR01549 family) [Pseudomonas flavescens]